MYTRCMLLAWLLVTTTWVLLALRDTLVCLAARVVWVWDSGWVSWVGGTQLRYFPIYYRVISAR